MQSYFLTFPQGRVHYLQFGRGPELLFALHGFGDRARMFMLLEPVLAERYTVIAIDWPFHGQTEWQQDSFSKQNLLDIIQQIAEKMGHQRFSLMGFSFGARLAQAMLPELSGQLNHLYLLSPDGVKTKGMAAAIHTPRWVRRLLFWLLRRPGWFVMLLNLGRRLRLVPPMVHHFLTNNLTRPERFQRTFGCWLALDSFYLGRRKIKETLLTTGLPTDIYFGTQDEMITLETLQSMVEGLPRVRLHLLDEGHRLIGERLAAELKKVVDGKVDDAVDKGLVDKG